MSNASKQRKKIVKYEEKNIAVRIPGAGGPMVNNPRASAVNPANIPIWEYSTCLGQHSPSTTVTESAHKNY